MNRSHHTPWALLPLLAACAGPVQQQEPTAPPAAAIAPPPEVQPARPAPHPSLTLTGTVCADPSRTVRLVAPVDGRVEGLAVEAGDEVEAGRLVARLVGREAAELGIRQRQAESEYYLADKEARLKASLYDDGLIAERELTEALERRELAASTLAQMASFASGEVKAPRRATVLRRAVTNGQYVQAGDLLLEMADIGTVWVMGDVYESDISRVHEGDPVCIATLARPDEPRRATIDKVLAALDPDSKTMKVRIVLPNPDRHLLPGMFATINLDL